MSYLNTIQKVNSLFAFLFARFARHFWCVRQCTIIRKSQRVTLLPSKVFPGALGLQITANCTVPLDVADP